MGRGGLIPFKIHRMKHVERSGLICLEAFVVCMQRRDFALDLWNDALREKLGQAALESLQ